MKAISLIITGIFLTTLLLANSEKPIKSKVKNVTVFLNQAQVYRTGSFTANKGVSDIIFEGVSPYLNTSSLQVNGKGNYVILDIQYRIKQPEPIPPSNQPMPPQIVKDIAELRDSIALIDFDLDDIKNKKDVLALEKTVLMGNKFMQGQVDTIPELKQAMEYLRIQLNDINKTLNVVKRKEYALSKVKNRMTTRLAKLQSYNLHINPTPKIEAPKHQVVVTIQAKESVSGNLTINYMVNNAGWTAAYDIRANGVGKPIQLVQKANVYQNTGEDWDNVKLTLSTITPNQSLSKPYLNSIYLTYYNPTTYLEVYKKDRNTRGGNAKTEAAMAELDADDEFLPAYIAADYTQVNQTMTNVEYEIDLPYSIPTDGKTHMVAVQDHKLSAEYFHYLVPSIDKQAYLVAKVSDWNTLDLLPGNANIYFEGTYVGETSINTNVMADTIDLALGKDRGLVVERKKATETEKNELIGSNVIKTFGYDIKIKNNKLVTSNIIIEDRIPLSNLEEIKIKLLDKGKANYAETTGMLTWKMEIPTKQTKKVSFSYSVEYDKNKQLANNF